MVENILIYVKIGRVIWGLNATVGIHLWPVRLHDWDRTVALNEVNHAHFWPHWMLESSKHAPAWRAGEERWSPPALPVCLAGCRPRGQGAGMDGPVAASLLPRWLALSAGSSPGGEAPWRQAMIGYANFHLLPPQHLWTAWRNEGVVVLEPSRVCVCVLMYPFESQLGFTYVYEGHFGWFQPFLIRIFFVLC